MSDSRAKGYELEEKYAEKAKFGIRTAEDTSTLYYTNNGRKISIPEMNNSTVYFADVKLLKGQKCRVTLSTGQEIIIEG
jgi:hypothetical protein